MAERLQLPLPMWRVQLELLGGFRRLATIVAVCMVVLVAGILAMRRIFIEYPFPVVAGRILNILTAVQVLIVVLGGCNAVYRAMLRDYETKMIESHRLTPMSNMTVVIGYVFGSTLQITTLFVLFAIAGAIVSLTANLPVGAWLYGNLLLLSGGITLWSMALLTGLGLVKPFNPAPILLGIAALTFPFACVPGIALLLQTYSVLFAIWITTSAMTVAAPAVAIVAAVNLALTLFWLSAAAIRYRRPDLPALNGTRGLLLLFAALIIATAGIIAFDRITQSKMRGFRDADLPQMQWIATMVGALVLSVVPIAGAVKCRILVARGTSPRGWSDRVPDLPVAIISGLAICAVMVSFGTPVWIGLMKDLGSLQDQSLMIAIWSYSASACLLTTLTLRCTIRLAHPFGKSGGALVGFFVIFAWAGPVLGDFMRAEYQRGYSSSAVYSWVTGCSPVGTIISSWSDIDVPLWPGLLVQLAVLILLTYFARKARPESQTTTLR